MVGNKKKYIEFQPKIILHEDLDVWSNDSLERSGPNLISCENETLLLSERSKFGAIGLSLLLTYGGHERMLGLNILSQVLQQSSSLCQNQ